MGKPAKKESVNTEAVEPKSTMLTVQVLWACHAWNATPQEAAQQVVADLYEHLSRGGSVCVRVEELGGEEHTIEVAAGDEGRLTSVANVRRSKPVLAVPFSSALERRRIPARKEEQSSALNDKCPSHGNPRFPQALGAFVPEPNNF